MTVTPLPTPVHRPDFTVTLNGHAPIGINASHLEVLAGEIERLVRRQHPQDHVGVRLEWDGTIWIRIGFAEAQLVGTWAPTTAIERR